MMNFDSVRNGLMEIEGPTEPRANQTKGDRTKYEPIQGATEPRTRPSTFIIIQNWADQSEALLVSKQFPHELRSKRFWNLYMSHELMRIRFC